MKFPFASSLARLAPLAAVALILANPAFAQSGEPKWEAGVGIASIYAPHYRGSDQSQARALPLPYLVYRGDAFRVDREGVHAKLGGSGNLTLELSAASYLPSPSGESVARAGMPSLGLGIEVGPELKMGLYRGDGWGLRGGLAARASVAIEPGFHTRYTGEVLSPTLSIGTPSSSRNWEYYAGLSALIGSKRYNGYVYNVAPAYGKVGRPVYESRAGYAGAYALVGASKRFDSLWVGVFARLDDLHGARFADSPLVKSKTALYGGVAVAWVFASSSERVK